MTTAGVPAGVCRLPIRPEARRPHRRGRSPRPCARPVRPGRPGLIKTNFYKTELELGHCLRLPQEGPCECDPYLSCAKFVTPQYAPRLRERLKVERQLAGDAEEHGWDREVDRHQRIANRIISLLGELCDSRDKPEDAR